MSNKSKPRRKWKRFNRDPRENANLPAGSMIRDALLHLNPKIAKEIPVTKWDYSSNRNAISNETSGKRPKRLSAKEKIAEMLRRARWREQSRVREQAELDRIAKLKANLGKVVLRKAGTPPIMPPSLSPEQQKSWRAIRGLTEEKS